ncbi:hypothetical protein N431DRAFT_425747 [Stipitochalara longipes BDJ]|nr:hypothetical protein N431DRAFT_425747 [Stipitochalara longipes BDJ]
MVSQFSSLPFELRHHIYSHALDRSPRNVEVEVREGRVVPKTPPPALLHLNRESRNFVLSVYKPWLPQFAGSPCHSPYAALLAKFDPSKGQPVSCLDDVCFDMKQDMLFCQRMLTSQHTTAGWPAQLFGRIEELCLRNMAVNIEGNIDNRLTMAAVLKAKNLGTLCFLNMYSNRLEKKVELVWKVLKKLAKRDKAHNIQPAYIAPLIMAAPTLYFLPKSRSETPEQWYTCSSDRESSPRFSGFNPENLVSCQVWTTYKYPRPATRTATPPLEVPIMQKTNPRKRKAGKDLDAALAAVASERANRTRIWIRPDALAEMNDGTRRRLGIAVRAASSTTGASSSSAPASEASSSDAGSVASSSRPASDAGSVPDEDDNSEEPESESEDDDQEEAAVSQERIPTQLHAHRFNFDVGAPEVLVEWEYSPEMVTWEWVPKADLLPSVPVMIAAFIANNRALETGTPVRFHERNSGVVGFDFLVEFEGYPEEIFWTWVPESDMQARVPHMVDQWMIEDASEVNADENVDEQILAEQDYAEHVRAENNDDVKEEKEQRRGEEEAETKDTEMKDKEDQKDEDANDEDAGDEEIAEYVPKRFAAQRETPDGPEILVEWEDWPDEKDWTWEPVSNLQEDAPEMMKAWKASRKAKKAFKVFEVESILGKRKIKGEWHYLVKWKGFSKDEAKSLEPCEKLAVDVPELVEAFENRKPKRGRPKKAVGA